MRGTSIRALESGSDKIKFAGSIRSGIAVKILFNQGGGSTPRCDVGVLGGIMIRFAKFMSVLAA